MRACVSNYIALFVCVDVITYSCPKVWYGFHQSLLVTEAPVEWLHWNLLVMTNSFSTFFQQEICERTLGLRYTPSSRIKTWILQIPGHLYISADYILKSIWSNEYFKFWFEFRFQLILMAPLTIIQRCFREWLGTKQATNHYPKQWWQISTMPCIIKRQC